MYDVAAEHGGTSLNKELLQGSQLNNSLIRVLFESSLCKGGQMPMVEWKYWRAGKWSQDDCAFVCKCRFSLYYCLGSEEDSHWP